MENKFDFESLFKSKSGFNFGLNAKDDVDKNFILNDAMRSCLESYSFIVGLPQNQDEYLQALKQDITEYFADYEVENSIDAMCGIAFFRLQKANEKLALSQSFGVEESKLELLRKHAIRCKKEYEIISLFN